MHLRNDGLHGRRPGAGNVRCPHIRLSKVPILLLLCGSGRAVRGRFGSKREMPNSTFVSTKYRPIAVKDGYTLLEVKLETGKSHQIRVCLQSLGYYVVGDNKYGNIEANRFFRDKFKLRNQFLHSYKLVFRKNTGALAYLNGKEVIGGMSVTFNNIYKFFRD